MQAQQSKNLRLSYNIYQENNRSLVGLKVEHYRVTSIIGSGVYSNVYKGIDTKSNKLVALKVLDKYNLEQNTQNTEIKNRIRKYIDSEGQLLQMFNHQNILPVYEIYQNLDLKIIVTKYCRHGTLREQIQKMGALDEIHAINIIQQIAKGLSMMHSKEIIHRDLKADNIFKHNGTYMIGDFGFAKFIEQSKYPHTKCGSQTQAPEVKTGNYNLSADIWSLGALLFQMIANDKPFQERIKFMWAQVRNNPSFNFKLKNGGKPSKRILDFLNKTITIQPEDRLNWKQLTSHYIFKREHEQHFRNVFDISISSLANMETTSINETSNIYESLISQSQQNENQQLNQSKFTRKRQYFTISHLDQSEINEKVQEKQDHIYDCLCHFHLYCRIAEYIFESYILYIEDNNLIDLKRKENLELMYLLASRCFFYLSHIFDGSKKFDDMFFSEQVKSFKNQYIKNLYYRIQSKFKQYSKLLTEAENKKSTIIKEALKFSGRVYHQNIKMFVGIEILNFDKQEQLDLTQQYLNDLELDFTKIKNNITQKYRVLGKQKVRQQYQHEIKLIQKRINMYKAINQIQFEAIEKYGFQNYIHLLLSKKQKSQG